MTIKAVETRAIKKQVIYKSIVACNNHSLPAIKEQLIIHCGITWGTRRQGAQELLKELEGEESIHCDDEDVWIYSRWQKILSVREKDYLYGKKIIAKTFKDF